MDHVFKGIVSARTPLEELFQQELFSKEPCLQRNFFQRNSFLRNCFYKTTFEGIIPNNLFFCPVSLLRGYLTIIPRNRFQGLFFHMSLIHISKPPISKHPYQSTHLTVPGAPFGRSVIPFRHSLTSPLFTFRQSKNCLHSNKQYSPRHGSAK